MRGLIDTHAHLDFPDFEADLPQVLERAAAAGIERIITVGTSIEGSRRAVALARKHSFIHAVVGVHPNSAQEAGGDFVGLLRELAGDPRVAAIGETGLDYHRPPHDKEAQARVFRQQLDLACELGLNVVIHQRDAWEDTLSILRPYTGRLRAVFHCFGNSLQQASEVLGMGHLISFTGIITFKNAPVVKENAERVPETRYMVETDCPYLAPVPFRGKRCEPAHTRQVAETLAALRGETFECVAAQSTANAKGFFRF